MSKIVQISVTSFMDDPFDEQVWLYLTILKQLTVLLTSFVQVHFPTLEKLASRFGLMLVGKRRFENYFSDFKTKGRDLLLTMNSLELFPPRRGDVLKGDDVPDNYASAQVTN